MICLKSKKIMFVSRRRAKKAARKVEESKEGLSLRVYVCPHCRHYHMTSSRDERRGIPVVDYFGGGVDIRRQDQG
jgi:hypothetical protein